MQALDGLDAEFSITIANTDYYMTCRETFQSSVPLFARHSIHLNEICALMGYGRCDMLMIIFKNLRYSVQP